MNQILNLFSETVVQALGWTLLHSLWQGALLAIILSLLMLALHRHTSKTRYTIAASALLFQVLVSAITFDHYYFLPAPESVNASITLATAPATSVVIEAPASFSANPLGIAKVYFEQHMPLIVTFWLMGLLLMALRFIGGLAYTQRLRHYKTIPLSEKWQQRLAALRQELGMSKAVRLVESAMVKVPMAIGYTKPVILLPVGAVTGLSQAQVEAILAHELAHILRRDYLFNIIQSVVDIIFFYHPAMWWISGLVRAERENCCDDIAVSVCGSNLTYARALAELEAMRMPAGPALAMAFSGKRHTLLSRIKRLVGQESIRPTFAEGFIAALVLVAGLTAFSYGAMASLKQLNHKEVAEKIEMNTTPATTEIATTSELITWEDDETTAYTFKAQDGDGKTRDVVIIKNKKGEVTELYVDGKKIPKKDIPKYTELINQRLEAIEKAPKATTAQVQAGLEEERKVVARAKRNQQRTTEYTYQYVGPGDSAAFAPHPPMPPMPPMAPMPRMSAFPPMPPMAPLAPLSGDKEAQKRYKEELKQHEKEIQLHREELKKHEQEMRRQFESGAISQQRYQEQVERHQKQAEAHAKRAEEMAKRHEEMAHKHEERAREHEARMKELRKEMIKDGFIKNEEDKVDIRITKDSLYVNGEKQSQELYEKYKKLMNVNITGEGNFRYQKN
ncbi:beta-lactamase regulating signal transducer with metallopeptidase domain [Pontibacter aydingkolensis]|uniref:M48 family metalloprotease n=1 Tax=Pontibacter aydingkolensis TaxID=1911536 RepID=A0ABS7CT75_9BACT|nr:M56 family metallopeptidase [Pontibacter aydingkolensis]MBW7467046.1 M48 family metalloprotease [Pontibacter aydingkolensis]